MVSSSATFGGNPLLPTTPLTTVPLALPAAFVAVTRTRTVAPLTEPSA